MMKLATSFMEETHKKVNIFVRLSMIPNFLSSLSSGYRSPDEVVNSHAAQMQAFRNILLTRDSLTSEIEKKFSVDNPIHCANAVLALWGAEKIEGIPSINQLVNRLVSQMAGEDPHNYGRLAVLSQFTLDHVGALGLTSDQCDQLRSVLNARGSDYGTVASEVRHIIGGVSRN